MIKKIDLIRNPKYRNKFCIKLNKSIGCQQAHYCPMLRVPDPEKPFCTFWVLTEVIYLMDIKNIPLGEAIRLVQRR